MPRLALELAAQGIDVGLWSANRSVVSTPLIPPASSVARIDGKLAEALDNFNADVVHDNGIWLPHNHHLARISRRRALPRIVSTRGMLEPWAVAHKRWKKRIGWLAYQRRDLATASALHATSSAEAANLERLGLGVRVHTIGNGIDLPPGPWADLRSGVRECRTALFLGRIYPVKGLPLLVEAWARVRPTGWRLRIAGSDEAGHRAQIERAIRSFGLEAEISFAGAVSGEAKARELRDADLFVQPSLSESFGMSIAEALAHELPVLTTKAAPWPMLASSGCGWWVDASVDGIAAGLREATAANVETLSSMGRSGRRLVMERFAWPEVARQVIAAYEALLAGLRSKAACPPDQAEAAS